MDHETTLTELDQDGTSILKHHGWFQSIEIHRFFIGITVVGEWLVGLIMITMIKITYRLLQGGHDNSIEHSIKMEGD